jgi:hypothetical protein
MATLETIMVWDGKRVDTMSQQELIAVIRSLGSEVERLQEYANTRMKYDAFRLREGCKPASDAKSWMTI